MTEKENKEAEKKKEEKGKCKCEEKKEEKYTCGCEEGECTCGDDCKCEEKKDNYLEIAQRIQAEFDNYRKRSADVVRVAKQEGITEAVLRFLPALDSFEKAKKMTKDEAVLEGVNLIEKKIRDSLKELEVEEIESKGQHYDPNLHNVVAVKHDNALEDGIIVDVYQAGYKIKEKIIRYAQVIVNKNKEV
jgi:molecular chaperone GrpE